MKLNVSLLLVSVLAAAPATAQISGSINRDAPKVTNTIAFAGGAKLSITYTAIHFGEGNWQSLLDNKERYEGFNKSAARKPIGSATISTGLKAAGRDIPAGTYDMFFTLHEEAGWLLNLKNHDDAEAKPIMWRLVLSDAATECKRIKFELLPGDASNEAVITIAFGKKAVTVPLTQSSGKEEKSGGE